MLLLWPGGLFEGGANFGVPQLLSIAGAVRAAGGEVTVVDLDSERAFGPLRIGALGAGYDLIGVACYSSYDYLKVLALGEQLRAAAPRAWLVVGGYHPSARPDDFTAPESPYDYVVVGDGEGPIARLTEALSSGKRPLQRVLGPASSPGPGAYDWSLLERYRPVARRVASQAEIYLSRGCPYDCAFCMERAKRDTSWRALEPGEALEEMHRLDRFLDLRGWTLFVADALFGMKQAWRRELLAGLARRPLRADKIWLLIRIDLIEQEDIELMARANVAPGFGLESGDPEQVRRIRKGGKLSDYLDRMVRIAGWARERNVPFGANVILGHPGETEASVRTTAAYLKRLFLDDPRGTTGFLSIDPFRLYPGSPIDEELASWQQQTGFVPHRYPWWHDGDQDFLSEWVDPSASLDFRRTLRLKAELLDPILQELPRRFAYQGPAREYFLRSIDEQVRLTAPRYRLRKLALEHLWRGLLGGAPQPARRQALRGDGALAEAAREAREEQLGRGYLQRLSPRIAAALALTPREQFTRLEDACDSDRDIPLPLTDDGLSTISAMHAYAFTYEALGLVEGDHLVELGSGTGYGAALASRLVGPEGSILTLEWEPTLAALAAENTAELGNVEAQQGDAHEVGRWGPARRVAVTFSVGEIPEGWLEALEEGGRLVAPVGPRDRQRLMLVERREGRLHRRALGDVVYVRDRAEEPALAREEEAVEAATVGVEAAGTASKRMGPEEGR